jgi:alpha-L-rhamnosidase
MGKNITGWVRMAVSGGTAGDCITLRFGEAQHANGALNSASNNAACQEDRYTLKGGGAEIFEPRFTFHGFQFVEISGYPGTPDQEAVTGCFVRTAVPQTGTFECGNDVVSNIHRCTVQSQLCNVQMGVPTDDTQRPERQGWGADAWGTAREALYNLWMPRVYAKWIGDFCDQQDDTGMVGMIAPQAGANEDLVWSSAFLLIPWWQYLHCGDRRILEDNYPAMQRYVSFLQRLGTRDVSVMPTGELLEKLHWINGTTTRFPAAEDAGHLQISQWGDHLATAEGSASRSNLPLSIATAFYYLDAVTMARIARVLGKTDDARSYEALSEEIKSAFNERFFDEALGYYDTGIQSAQAWPLVFGLVADGQRERVQNYFVRSVEQVQRRLTTGYTSTAFAIHALSDAGRDDLVWKLATSTEYPSWGYMLRNNRTTSCERWDGDGGSLNHAPLGAAIDEWFYWGLAGIRPDESAPGFERIIFKPHLPPDLPWAKASIKSARGAIVSAWEHDGGTAILTVSVPANSTGMVHVPTSEPESVTETDGPAAEAEGVTVGDVEDGRSVFVVGSGTYVFTFRV